MTEEELLLKIHYHSRRLGMISMLAFRKERLEEILNELEKLSKICIYEEGNDS